MHCTRLNSAFKHGRLDIMHNFIVSWFPSVYRSFRSIHVSSWHSTVYILCLTVSICSRAIFFTAPKKQFCTLLHHYCGNLFNLGEQCVHIMCCSSVLACRNGTELHKVLHPRAGWSGWCGVHWRGGGVWPGGPGAAQGHQSTLHEGAGTRSSHSTLAGKPWHELRL